MPSELILEGYTMTNVEVWLWILLVMLPHNPRTAELLSRYPTALEAAVAMRDGKCELLTPAEKQRVERTRTRDVRALIAQCEHLGIRIVTMDNPEYPQQLRLIEDPPIVLFVKGDLSPLRSMAAVAVVGPRMPSEYGRLTTENLCGELVQSKIGVISGLAVGVDGEAHRSTVANGGYTVGVLGCGLEVDYPKENYDLKKQIVEKGGAVISELLPYSSASSLYFRKRNRIIAGLSSAAVVIEAGVKSGSLVTAGLTHRQGKPVFCVPPHDIYDGSLSGGVQILRDYALPLYGIEDIYSVLSRMSEKGESILPPERIKKAETKPAPRPSPKRKEAPEEEKSEPVQEMEFVEVSNLSPEETQVVALLREKSLTMDEIIQKSGRRHDEICSIVLGLELGDVIVRNQDGTFVLV